jgi:outer membrane immunogenic protein
MKKFLLRAAVLMSLVAATAAPASEINGGVIPPDVFTAPPAFAPPRVYNWTGVYIGANAGGGWGSPHWVSTPDGDNGNYRLSGGLLGGTIGYNLQADNSSFVLGVEADLAWSSIKGTLPPNIVPELAFDNTGAPIIDPRTGAQIVTPTAIACVPNCEVINPWLATVLLRLGYSFDWILPYVTAGAAIGRLEANIAGIPMGRQSSNNLGWAVGAGVEMVISGPWTAKLEFLHANLNGFNCDMACPIASAVAPPIVSTGVSINAAENIIRVGLNYRIWNH